MMSPPLAPSASSVLDLVRHAEGRVNDCPAAATDAIVETYRAAFDAARFDGAGRPGVNIVTFHAEVPESHRFIDYVDVKHDHHGYDYQRIIRHFADSALRFNPDARIFFVTGEAGPEPAGDPRICIVRLPIDTRAPMYERVKAAVAYIRSTAFDRDTIFLDTDAFPNRALAGVFGADFDLGVTERPTQNFYMPLNEGVIFASARRRGPVRRFFEHYVGTYDALITDPIVGDYYGDVTRWRGGQLSLNATAFRLSASMPRTPHLPKVSYLPCETYNFLVGQNSAPDPERWDEKFVLHLRGGSKMLISQLEQYQNDRWRSDEEMHAAITL